jgi:hypothetical protein
MESVLFRVHSPFGRNYPRNDWCNYTQMSANKPKLAFSLFLLFWTVNYIMGQMCSILTQRNVIQMSRLIVSRLIKSGVTGSKLLLGSFWTVMKGDGAKNAGGGQGGYNLSFNRSGE